MSAAGHERIQQKLEASLRLQKLLADLSARFVALPSGQIDRAIEETQRLIVSSLGVDRSTLWQFDDPGDGMRLTHYWQPPEQGLLPKSVSVQELFPWASAKLLRGESVAFSQLAELPPEAAQDAEVFRTYGTQSSVTLPLQASGRVFGAFSFASLHRERVWTAEEISALQLIAQIVGNVIARQRADLRVERLREELVHSSRVASLGEMASALAHELNQPLAAILSNAQAARRFLSEGAVEPGELREILDDIIRDDKRAAAVIQNLRSMLSKRPGAREKCCINTLVREVLELLQGELLGQIVHLDLPDGLPSVDAVRVELQQVLVNLLLNAVQAMSEAQPDARRIEIATSLHLESVFITVRDHGCGIPAARMQDVFEPFFTTKANGLGMGLSICRHIAESYGGRMEARNHAGGGAAFSLLLPASQK